MLRGSCRVLIGIGTLVWTLTGLALASATAEPAPAAASGIVDLGTLPGGSQSVAVAINDAGTIVGAADSPTGWHAVR
jgi:hypothetical protein